MLLRQVPRKLLRGVSIGLTTVAFGGSAYFLYRNDFDVSSIGAMRLARAGIAATKIIVDYKWTLRKLDPETEEYKTIKSMVHKRSAELLLQLACANGGVYIK
uniref:ADCK1 n=1 Tax=Plectus sambesii TaxID=2011161 RepID=A0A914VWS8_9BILA